MEKLITIKTYTYLTGEVLMLKLNLEAEGIMCFLKDEMTITADPLISNALGGIKLQIKESDLELAKMVLKNIYNDNSIENLSVKPLISSKSEPKLSTEKSLIRPFGIIIFSIILILLALYLTNFY
jgi:hypothetical protein